MRYTSHLLAFLFILLNYNCYAQKAEISPSSGIKYGVLDNGLTYYIKNTTPNVDYNTHHESIDHRYANFYLIQNVGAILENDKQDGLAHFLEHMCFKGTKHYPGRAIFDLFEKNGLKNAINAYTQVEETVYYLNRIPLKDQSLIDNSLVILHDWCNYIDFTDEAIDGERGVIVEEIRMRRNLNQRLNEQTMKATHNGSKYSKRFVGGTPEIIKNFDKQELIDYYNDWYRTDLQCVVVIGNIDAYEIEQKIKTLFGQIPAHENPIPRPEFLIPDNKETLYCHATDPDVKEESISIQFRHFIDKSIDHEKQFETKIFHELINRMYRRRAKQAIKDDSLYLDKLVCGYYDITRNYKSFSLDVTHKEGKAKEALNLAVGIHKDVLENSFTQEEIDFILDQFESQIKGVKKMGGRFPLQMELERIKNHFLKNEPITSANTDYKIFKQLKKKIGPEYIKAEINRLYDGPNKSICVITKEDNQALTKEEVLEIETGAEAFKVIPEEEKEEDESKRKYDIDSKIKIVDTEPVREYDAKKFKLSNGATVIYKHVEDSHNRIIISAVSNGGTSQVDKKHLLEAESLPVFGLSLGIDGMTEEQFEDWKDSKFLHPYVTISDSQEEMMFMTNYESIEDAFYLMYNYFEKPAFYQGKYDEVLEELNKSVAKNSTNYQAKLRDSIRKIMYPEDKICFKNENTVKDFSLKDLKSVWSDRFKDASNFVFYIVGSVSESKAKQLAQRYIGSIKSTNSNESYQDIDLQLTKAYNKRIFYFETPEQKAGNVCILNNSTPVDYKQKLTLNLLKLYINDRMVKILREKLNGTYNVSVSTKLEERSKRNYSFSISYETDPEKLVVMNKAMLEVIGTIANQGIDPVNLEKMKKQMKNGYYPPAKDIQYYINKLQILIDKGEDLSKDDLFTDTIDEIDVYYFNELTNTYMKNCKCLDVLYLPK